MKTNQKFRMISKNEVALLNEEGIGEIYDPPRLSLEFKVEILGMGGGVI